MLHFQNNLQYLFISDILIMFSEKHFIVKDALFRESGLDLRKS